MEEQIQLTIHLPILKKPLNISLSHSDSFKTVAEGLCQQYNLPPYYTIPLLSAITSTFNHTTTSHTYINTDTKTDNDTDTSAADPSIELQTRQAFVNAYQENTLQYYNKHEEDEFPRAFNTLVKCPITVIFDALLELDQNYTLLMHDLAAEHHHALMAIQTRQAQEMEGAQSQNGSHLFVQHVEEMEIKQATFASDILQTQQSQRQEYRDFVMELYREYQMRTSALYENSNSDDNTQLNSASPTTSTGSKVEIAKSIDGKDLVTTAANRIWKKDTGSSSSSSSFSLSSSPSTTKQSYSEQHQQQQPRRQRQDSTTSRLSQQSMTSDSWKRSSIGSSSGDDLAMQKMVQDIQEMGFTKDQAEAALTLTNGQNVERAINILVENPDQIDQQMKRRSFSQQQQHGMASPTSASPPPPQTSSSSSSLHQRQDSWNDSIPSFRRHSLQKPTPLNSSSTTSLQQHKPLPLPAVSSTTPTNGGKSWNPISFFQQQKQALENTNLSSVRKFSGWLGKAMENFGIEHDENSDPSAFGNSHGNGISSQLVESFTITLGTAQIKSSHNLRLLVADLGADLLDPLPFDEQRELGYKAQTAMRLYTSQLSAILVLVDKSELCQTQDAGGTDAEQGVALDWRQYKMGKGSNRALNDRTLRSTEFHFPTTESQLDLIEKNVQQNQKDYLQEGAFFITKHSNLPMHQIVFHLIIDGDAVSKTDLSSRHPLMIGLRNILRLTTRYDISSLSLPLVMLPDRFLDQPEHYMPATVDQPQLHVNWLSKRSEALMKTVKGYLMEASRGKQSHNEMHHRADTSAFGGSGLRNIEFFIPMQQNIYVADPLTTPTSTSAPPSSTIMHQPPPPPPPPTHSSSSSSLSAMTTASASNISIPQQQQQQQQQSAEATMSNTNNNNNNSSSGMTINASMSNNNNASSISLPSTPTAASHQSHYTRTPTPQVEQVFQQLRTSLVSIFRTS
ncbi:hypothetical protein BCR42DRAFT_497288 [Absidia repens]|uniref:UBA domain-containing protein n=1 Tax=Absidia repens TaxID=90262 RepID=A0A1X2HKK7_9FUNG|nr:hypothetical protein BCR42DRAFT_497288 [Absidia repens]